MCVCHINTITYLLTYLIIIVVFLVQMIFHFPSEKYIVLLWFPWALYWF